MDGRTRAIRLLRHYLRTVWSAAGLRWDGDNDAEVGLLVDAIIEAATQEHEDILAEREAILKKGYGGV